MDLESHGAVSPALHRAVQGLVDEGIIASACYRHSTASTNQDAIDQVNRGELTATEFPKLYICDRQTAGRGRQGNTWHSTDDALTISLAVAEPKFESSFPLSVVVGVAVARAIEFLHPPVRIRLKWPNDIYLQAGKVGGILIESTGTDEKRFVVGVGINIDSVPIVPDDEFQSNTLRPQPKSLSQTIGQPVDRAKLLSALIESICESIVNSGPEDIAIVRQEYRERCILERQPITLRQPDGNQVLGRCEGIDDEGRLVVNTESGVIKFQTGEANLIRQV